METLMDFVFALLVSPRRLPLDTPRPTIKSKPSGRLYFDADVQTIDPMLDYPAPSASVSLAATLSPELIHRILLALARLGHKEALLAALVVRNYAMEFLEISYDYRVVHWTQIGTFQRLYSRHNISGSHLKALTIDLNTGRQMIINDGHSIIATLNSPPLKVISTQSTDDEFAIQRAVELFSMPIDNLTLIDYLFEACHRHIRLQATFRDHIRHLTLIERQAGIVKSGGQSIFRMNFSSCQSVWIISLDTRGLFLHSCIRFTFPVVKRIYLIVNFDPATQDIAARAQQIANGMRRFARVTGISPEARVAVVILVEGHQDASKLLYAAVDKELKEDAKIPFAQRIGTRGWCDWWHYRTKFISRERGILNDNYAEIKDEVKRGINQSPLGPRSWYTAEALSKMGLNDQLPPP